MRPPVTIHPPSRRLAADVLCFVLRRAGDAATPPALFPATFYGGLTVVHRGGIRDAASGQPLPPVTLSSGHTRPLRLVCDAGTVASSVVFKPGRLPALCGGPAPLRANTFVDAATVWPAAVHGGLLQALQAQTAAAGDMQRLQVLETFLLRRQAATGTQVDPFEARLAPLFGQLGTMQVARLSEQLALAPRSLQRRFRDRYGMAPKTFIRLARLHDALRRVQAAPGRQRPGWAQLAGQCGFADQAHLLREFKALTGHTPVALLALLDAPDGAAWAFRIPPETLDWAAAPATAEGELALA